MNDLWKGRLGRFRRTDLVFAALLTILWAFNLHWPIVSFDTDFWYHLAGGREIFTVGRIPRTSYFSYIEPGRDFIDYYWGFQALLYAVYRGSGYMGLIVLRGVLLLAFLLTVWLYLRPRRESAPAAAGAFALTVLLVTPFAQRTLLLRPHSFSYLGMALFLWLQAEDGGRRRWVLPFLTVLWVNLHGITYPVLVLLVLADLIRYAWGRRRSPGTPLDLHRVLPGVLSLWCILLTPHGFRLLALPFRSLGLSSLYIAEMLPPKAQHLLNLDLSGFVFNGYSAFNLVLVAAAAFSGRLLWRRRLDPIAFLIFLAGLYLLGRGLRFYFEAVILALPVLRSGLDDLPGPAGGGASGLPLPLAAAVLLAFSSVYTLYHADYGKMRRPVSYERLPHGVVAYLDRAGQGGRLLVPPGMGGYFEWRLYPKYRIYADLQLLMFTDRDIFYVDNAYARQAVLDRFLEQYRPEYVVVALKDEDFGKDLRSRGYRTVFFDDVAVCFARRGLPWGMPVPRDGFSLDPFRLAGTDISKLSEANKAKLREELLRADAVFPDVLSVNLGLAILSKDRHEYGPALAYARWATEIAPEKPLGYRVVGDVLAAWEQWDQALDAYDKALERAAPEQAREILRSRGRVLGRMGRYGEAYKAFLAGVRPFHGEADVADLMALGMVAERIGRTDQAVMFYEFASLVAGEGQETQKRDALMQLRRFRFPPGGKPQRPYRLDEAVPGAP